MEFSGQFVMQSNSGLSWKLSCIRPMEKARSHDFGPAPDSDPEALESVIPVDTNAEGVLYESVAFIPGLREEAQLRINL